MSEWSDMASAHDEYLAAKATGDRNATNLAANKLAILGLKLMATTEPTGEGQARIHVDVLPARGEK